MSKFNFSKYDGNNYGGGDEYIKDTDNRKYPSVSLIYDVVKPNFTAIDQKEFVSEHSSSEEVLDWKAKKTKEANGTTLINDTETLVTIPHTFNVDDCKSSNCWSGYAEYSREFDLDEDKDHYLTIYQMVQRGNIYVDGELIKINNSGFLPCTVKLPSGKHNVVVETHNPKKNVNYIPYSADYAFVNGIVGKAKIQHFKGAYIDPIEYGYQRCHITTIDCNSDKAIINVKTKVTSQNDEAKNVSFILRIEIVTADNNKVVTKDIPFYMSEESFNIDSTFEINNPILWNGKANPYLYDVKLSLYYESTIIDEETIKYGIRRFDYPLRKNRPARLNGEEIILRGTCMHQDSHLHSVAMTDEDYEKETQILNDLGCNYVRITHYPHNVKRFDELDKNGILCQTEIPWVNWYGTVTSSGEYTITLDVPSDYDKCIKEYAHEMLRQLYNHPSIVLWGLCNEVGNESNFSKNNELTYRFVNLVNDCVEDLHMFGPRVYVGLTQNIQLCDQGLSCDWMTYNTYPCWYNGSNPSEVYSTDDVTVTNNFAAANLNYLFNGVGEYGYGSDPNYHGDDWLTANTVNGKFQNNTNSHYEEYATLCHIKAWNNIVINSAQPSDVYGSIGSRYFKNMTTIWIFKDFAVPNRNEGGEPGINDKGLITRDWNIKKDAYFMYKSLWNNEPIIYICEKRWEVRESGSFKVKIFCNSNQPVSLYEITDNGEVLIATKETPTLPSCNLYEFNNVSFTNLETKTIKLIARSGNLSDEYECRTNANLTSNLLSVLPNEITALFNSELIKTINVTANGEWQVDSYPEWITLSKQNGTGNDTITVTFSTNDTINTRIGDIQLSSITHQGITYNVHLTQYCENGALEINSIKCTSDTGYFKTDYLINQNTDIEAKFGNCLELSNSKVFGINEANCKCYIYTSSGNDFNAEFGNSTTKVGSSNKKITIPHTSTSDVIFKINKNEASLTVDEKTERFYYATPTNDFTSTIPLYIGQRNDSIDKITNIVFYYLKIYENDILIHHYVPCLVDNEICLIDKIKNDIIKPSIGTWVNNS